MSDKIRQYLVEESQAWAADFVRARRAYLRRSGTTTTGALDRSLQYEVREQAHNEAVQLLLAFEEYGRYIDMRRLKPAAGGKDYVAEIIEWIKEKGLEQKFTAGYVRRRGLKRPPEKVLQAIAWGIIIKRHRGKYRRRRWYNRPKSGAIEDLYTTIRANMPDEVAAELRAALKQ